MPSSQFRYPMLLASRAVQDEVIGEAGLKASYGDGEIEDARKDLQRNTEVFEDHRNGIVTITISDTRGERAARIAQAYLNALAQVALQLNKQSAREQRLFLEGQLARVRAELQMSEAKASTFAADNDAFDPPEQIDYTIDSNEMLRDEVLREEAELQRLTTIYGDDERRVRISRARIKQLARDVDAALNGEADGGSSSEIPAVRINQPLRAMPSLLLQYKDESRDTKGKEQIVQAIEEAYRAAQFAEASDVPVIAVLDPPNLPETRCFSWGFWMTIYGACGMAVLALVQMPRHFVTQFSCREEF